MFGALKDIIAGSALKALLAGRLQRYASLDELHIDSRARSLRLVVTLAGEAVPLELTAHYLTSQHNGQSFLTLLDTSANRPWIDHLLADLLASKPFPVPALALAALGGPHD